jgi:hypothetical protein
MQENKDSSEFPSRSFKTHYSARQDSLIVWPLDVDTGAAKRNLGILRTGAWVYLLFFTYFKEYDEARNYYGLLSS